MVLAGMFAHPFVRNAFLAGTAIAVAVGMVGYFVVLRSQVFTGDALSHVAVTGALGALAFGLLSKLVNGPQVLWIQLTGFAQVDDCLRGIAALAFKNSKQTIDLVILRSQIAGCLQALRRGVVVSLPQG